MFSKLLVLASVLTASYASNTSQYIDWRRTDVEKATDPSMIMKPVQVYSAKEQSDDLFQRTKTKGKCDINYMGSSCNQKVCPFGLSFDYNYLGAQGKVVEGRVEYAPSGRIDYRNGLKVYGIHAYTECSSRGKCDRARGQCKCFAGYEGQGCRRQECPNECSGHGVCQQNTEVNSNYQATETAFLTRQDTSSLIETGDFETQFWDKKMARSCACDRGWKGYDCSERTCPLGYEVAGGSQCDTAATGKSTQVLTLDSNGKGFFTLTFFDDFNGEHTTYPIKFAPAPSGQLFEATMARRIEEALESVPNRAVPNAKVEPSKTSANTYEITFDHDSTPGRQKLIQCSSIEEKNMCHWGVLPRYSTSKSVCKTVTYKEKHMGLKLRSSGECSNRGKCDTKTGLCDCFSGYTGRACDSASTYV